MSHFAETSLGRTGWHGLNERESRKSAIVTLLVVLAMAMIPIIVLSQVGVI